MKMVDYLAVMKQAAENLQLSEDKDITTWQELASILITFEGTIARFSSVTDTNVMLPDLAAHLVYNKQTQNQYPQQKSFSPNRGGSNQGNYSGNYSQNNFSRGNGRGRGRGRNGSPRNNNSRPTCQLCGKFGHSAPYCYFRFEEDFNNSHSVGGSNSQGNNNTNTTTYIATPEVLTDPKWLADSGATSHVMADVNNLAAKNDYHGQGLKEGDAARNT